MEPTPAQIASQHYFSETRKALADDITRLGGFTSGPVQERRVLEDRAKLAHYQVIVEAQKTLYEDGQKVELPEDTKQFLAEQAAFYEGVRASRARMYQYHPTAVESIRQFRLDMGLIAPAPDQQQPKDDLPEIPHIPRDLPVITGSGSYQHQQER